MEGRIVVGLFESHGIAEDAGKRLRTEGVPETEISVRVMKEVGPLPTTSDPELAALEIDPLVFGDVRKTFAPYTRNGETLVMVRAANEAEATLALETMRQYAPIGVEMFYAGGGDRPRDE